MNESKILKTCCITGHRKIPDEKMKYVERELRREVDLALAEGYTHFISGFAEGTDQLFVKIVAEKRKLNGDIQLEAAIPYRNRVAALQKDPETRRLLGACTIIGVHSEKYSSDCYLVRNRFMVQTSGRVIAVYDGRMKGGTVMTLRFAHIYKREIREIRI